MIYALFNPLADNNRGRENAEKLAGIFPNDEITYLDILENHAERLIKECQSGDTLILAGGDGTINRFVNSISGIPEGRDIYYYPTGSGNDFTRDVKAEKNGLILLNPYIKSLPTVTIKGSSYSHQCKFVNGVGFGLDGYCCEKGDEHRKKSDKAVNYAAIAIKGLAYDFKPVNAAIIVDGVKYRFKKVWLAPTMNGRYYGGGMCVAPKQDRLDPKGTVSLVVMHSAGKLKTLMVFPSIFKGEHIKHKEMVTVLTGREIHVVFDRPTALQVDGETATGISGYTVRSAEDPSHMPTQVSAITIMTHQVKTP